MVCHNDRYLAQPKAFAPLRLCNIFSETMTGQSTDTLSAVVFSSFCLSFGKKNMKEACGNEITVVG